FGAARKAAENYQPGSVCPLLPFTDGENGLPQRIGAPDPAQSDIPFLRKRASWLSSSERRGSRWTRPSNSSQTSYRTFDGPASTVCSYGKVSAAFQSKSNNQLVSREYSKSTSLATCI